MNIIPKFASGGRSWAQIDYEYAPQQQQSSRPQGEAAPSKSSDKDSGKLTEKDLFDMIKGIDALPNEVTDFIDSMQSVLLNPTFGDKNKLAMQYTAALKKLKLYSFNKKEYDNAYQRAVETKSLKDAAISTEGYVYALREGAQEYELMTPEQYAQEKEKDKNLTLLTNSNLLWMRANLPNMVGKNMILQTVENGISLETVSNYLKDLFVNIGDSKQTNEYFVDSTTKQGMEILKSIASNGPEGYHRIKEMRQNDKSVNYKVNAALTYMYDMLPTNARVRLKLQTKNKTDKEAADIILAMITRTLDTSTEVTDTFYNTKEAIEANKQKAKSESSPKLGYWGQIQADLGGSDAVFTLFKDKGEMTVEGKIYGAIPGMDKDMTLTEFINKSGIGYMLQDKNKINFGSSTLPVNSFNEVMVKSSSNGFIAILPKKADGSVNLELVDGYTAIMEQLRGLDPNSQQYKDKLKNLISGTPYEKMYDSNGLPNKKYFGHFFIIEGLASSNTKVRQGSEVNNLEEITNNYIVNRKDELLDTYAKGTGVDVDHFDWYNPLDWASGYTKIYEGNLYLPINDNPTNAANADKTGLTRKQAYDYERNTQAAHKYDNLNSTQYK